MNKKSKVGGRLHSCTAMTQTWNRNVVTDQKEKGRNCRVTPNCQADWRHNLIGVVGSGNKVKAIDCPQLAPIENMSLAQGTE